MRSKFATPLEGLVSGPAGLDFVAWEVFLVGLRALKCDRRTFFYVFWGRVGRRRRGEVKRSEGGGVCSPAPVGCLVGDTL